MLVKGNLCGFAVYMPVYVIIFVSHRQTNKRSVFLLYWCHLFYLTKSLKLLVWDLGSSLLVHFSKSLVCWKESVPSMCSLGTSPEVHKQVWDCFPRLWSLCVLPSTFWIPQTPLQGSLSRKLAGAFFVLLCCALLQLDLHPGPSERRTEGKKCNEGWLHPLRTTASVKEEEGFSFLGILSSVSSHYRPPPPAYNTITWGLGMRKQEERERKREGISIFLILSWTFPTSRDKVSWSSVSCWPLPGVQSIQLSLQPKHRGKQGGDKGERLANSYPAW